MRAEYLFDTRGFSLVTHQQLADLHSKGEWLYLDRDSKRSLLQALKYVVTFRAA